MTRSWMATLAAGLLLAVPAGTIAQEASAATAAADTVNAVWVDREVNLNYSGFTSYYSCDGLEDKVGWILEQLGARPGFKVKARNCQRLTGPELMPSARIVAAFPVAATPEVLAELQKGAAERELAARATGKSAPPEGAAAQFPARVRRVEFRSSSGSSGDLQDGDCELMDKMRRQVFDPLGVKVVEHRISCTPGQVTLGAVRMTVEVLEPMAAMRP